VLLAAELLNWMFPCVLVKLLRAVKSSIAFALAEGEIEIFPPPDGPTAPAEDAVKVPLLIVVVPVYVFVPLNVSVPVPVLIMLPVPPMTPA